MLKLAKRFLRDEQGLELSEYAIMAALVIAVAAATIYAVGVAIDTRFGTLEDNINGTVGGQ